MKEILTINELPIYYDTNALYIFDIEVMAKVSVPNKRTLMSAMIKDPYQVILTPDDAMITWMNAYCPNVMCVLGYDSCQRIFPTLQRGYFLSLNDAISNLSLPKQSNDFRHVIDYYVAHSVWNVCYFKWTHVVFVSNKSHDIKEVEERLPHVECFCLYK